MSAATMLHRKQKMSLSQTYYLAHTARGKLSKEAARSDHQLRLLVGHANLLDGLMLDLADAEREQESWFNETVRKASEPSRRVTWADELPRLAEEAEQYDDDESSSDEDDDDMEVDDEDDEGLQLTRSPSHPNSPPDLLHESDSESDEDDHMPPSPPAPRMLAPASASATKHADKMEVQHSPEESFYEDGFYLPQRQAIAAY